jgi:hypothetical protein
VALDFQPLSRRLYWWAVGLLELLLVALAALASGRLPRQRSGAERGRAAGRRM